MVKITLPFRPKRRELKMKKRRKRDWRKSVSRKRKRIALRREA